jgi:hypothetical protein
MTTNRNARIGVRLLTAAWVVGSVVCMLVWAAICISNLDWQSPWWLWTLISPVPVLALLWASVEPGQLRNRLGAAIAGSSAR